MSYLITTHNYFIIFAFLALNLIGNVPVGFYRKRFKRFSRPWARCIYIPILVNIILRRLLHINISIVPFTVLFILIGQFIGSMIIRIDAGRQFDEKKIFLTDRKI